MASAVQDSTPDKDRMRKLVPPGSSQSLNYSVLFTGDGACAAHQKASPYCFRVQKPHRSALHVALELHVLGLHLNSHRAEGIGLCGAYHAQDFKQVWDPWLTCFASLTLSTSGLFLASARGGFASPGKTMSGG